MRQPISSVRGALAARSAAQAHQSLINPFKRLPSFFYANAHSQLSLPPFKNATLSGFMAVLPVFETMSVIRMPKISRAQMRATRLALPRIAKRSKSPGSSASSVCLTFVRHSSCLSFRFANWSRSPHPLAARPWYVGFASDPYATSYADSRARPSPPLWLLMCSPPRSSPSPCLTSSILNT